jgi:hypothetical protein
MITPLSFLDILVTARTFQSQDSGNYLDQIKNVGSVKIGRILYSSGAKKQVYRLIENSRE